MRKDRTISKRNILLCGLMLVSTPAYAAHYDCLTSSMYASGGVIDTGKVKQGQFSVKIEEKPEYIFLYRCSFTPSEGKVTCDKYEVDKLVYDENVKIKKFYVFKSQFDVQIFSDLNFIENNGRGGIAFGKCTLVAS